MQVHPSDQTVVGYLELPKHRAVIAGGCARRWYIGESSGSADIDVFFTDVSGHTALYRKLEDAAKKTSEAPSMIFGLMASVKNLVLGNKEIYVYRVCQSVDASTWQINDWTVQLIQRRFFPTVDDLLDDFDITVCKVATDGNRWVTGENFVDDMTARRLRITRPHPNNLARLAKYYSYGYVPDSDTLHTICSNTQTMWKYDIRSHEDYHNL